MRRKTPTELIKEAQRIGAATALPEQVAISVTGVPRDVAVIVPVDPDTALVERMADYAVRCVQHRQKRERLISDAVAKALLTLGQASDQVALVQEVRGLVTKDLG